MFSSFRFRLLAGQPDSLNSRCAFYAPRADLSNLFLTSLEIAAAARLE
jgi:hypothetical protein